MHASETTSETDRLASVISPLALGAQWPAGGVVRTIRREGDGLRLDLHHVGNPIMVLRVRQRDDGRQAFIRTASLDASHDGEGSDFNAAMAGFARDVVERLDANSDVAVALITAPRKHGGTALERRAASAFQGGYGEDQRGDDAPDGNKNQGGDNNQGDQRSSPFSRAHLQKRVAERIARHGQSYETVELILSNPCDMGCMFCPVGDLEIGARGGHYDDNEELQELRFQISQNDVIGASRLRVSGNDPLRHKLLPGVIEAARKHGFDKIRIVTPGLAARDPKVADMLQGFELETMEMPFYGHNDEVFSGITGVPESFTKADTAVRNLLKRGIQPELHGIAIEAFLPHLPATKDWIEREYGLQFRVGPYVPHQIDLRHHHLIPHRDVIKPWLDRFPEVFAREIGFPLCWFDDPLDAIPHERIRRSLSLYTLSLPYDELNGDDWKPPNEMGWPDSTCASCYLRGYPCPGVFSQYVDRHGLEGFSAVVGDSFR